MKTNLLLKTLGLTIALGSFAHAHNDGTNHNHGNSSSDDTTEVTIVSTDTQSTTDPDTDVITTVVTTTYSDKSYTTVVTTTYPDESVNVVTTTTTPDATLVGTDVSGTISVPAYFTLGSSEIPDVTWTLDAISEMEDLVDIDDTTVTVLKNLNIKVKVIGTGVTSGSGDDYTSYRTQGKLKVGDQSWTQVHLGNEDDVDVDAITYETTAEIGDEIQFKARYQNGDWQSYRANSGDHVLTLLDGDSIPTNLPTNSFVSSAEAYLSGYLNDDVTDDVTNGVTLDLGDKDMIFVAELTHTDSDHGGYDLQDLIILLQVEEIRTEVTTTN